MSDTLDVEIVPDLPAVQGAAVPSRLTRWGDAVDFRDLADAPNTRTAYRRQFRLFATWCAERGADPRDPGSVLNYLQDRAAGAWGARLQPSSLMQARAALARAFASAGLPFPTADVRAALRGARRQWLDDGGRERRAACLKRADLRAMVDALSDTVAGVRDRALVLLGFALGWRGSELVALDVKDLDEAEGGGLLVRQRRSKVDQAGAGRLVCVERGARVEACPVLALHAWISLAQITAGPVFRPVDRWGRIGADAGGRGAVDRMTRRAVSVILKKTATRAGVSVDPSAHSLRRSMATAAREAGADALSIARHGGWKDGSAALLRYLEAPDAKGASLSRFLGL